MLTGHSDFNRTAEKRARIMSSVGEVTRTRSVYVVDRARQESVEGTALIEREEIERIDDPEELEDIIRERAGLEEPA
jgi:putative transcriptional regulator